jgi:hypothetical protein
VNHKDRCGKSSVFTSWQSGQDLMFISGVNDSASHLLTVASFPSSRRTTFVLPLEQLIIKGVLPELFALFTSTLWFINISMTF